jgi:Polysaccharide lyase
MREADNREIAKFETRLTRGKWMRVAFGMRFATDNTGWVQFWINGKQIAPNSGQSVTGIPTLRMYNGSPDAVYIKQGVYRRIGWDKTHIIHFGPIKAGADCMDVQP